LIHHENGSTSAETYHLNVHRQVAWLARHEFSVTENGKELATEHLAMHPFFATDNGKKMPNRQTLMVVRKNHCFPVTILPLNVQHQTILSELQ